MSSLLGKNFVRTDPELAVRLNGQAEPLVSVFPGNAREVSDVLRLAARNGWTVAAVGGGTQLDFGDVPGPLSVAVHTSRLNAVVEHSPADMVVTVQSGMRLSDLQRRLAEHGQMLAIDPVCDDAATVGGVVATGVSGPGRVLYGTLRDMLIGAQVVLADGEVVRAGGKVVKNVAGYDLSKLLIGSLGTLGILTECTFKLKPLPLHRELCVMRGAAEQLDEVRRQVMDSLLIPSSLELVSGRQVVSGLGGVDGLREADSGGPWALLVGCDEGEQAAAFQTESLRKTAADVGTDFSVLRGAHAVNSFWGGLKGRLRSSRLAVRIQAPPVDLVWIAQEIETYASRRGIDCLYSISLSGGTGYVLSGVSEPSLQEDLIAAVRRSGGVRDAAGAIERASMETRRRQDVFFSRRLGAVERSIMRSVKRAFDPMCLLPTMKSVEGN